MTNLGGDRLDRIEAIVEANTRGIAGLRQTAEANTRDIAELRKTVTSLLEIVVLHQQSLETSQRNFEVVQAEIRGLQTENRRILDRLFGEDGKV